MTRPIQSMTGSSTEALSIAHFNLQIELKSVNSRFLDLSFKLADEVRLLEPALRERLLGSFLRGKIECKILVKSHAGMAQVSSPAGQINEQALAALRALEAHVLKQSPASAPLSVSEILRWPGVLPEASVPPDIEAASLQAMDKAIAKLIAARQTEGRALIAFVEERFEGIAKLVATVKTKTPELLAAYELKLVERWRPASAKPKPSIKRLARTKPWRASAGDCALWHQNRHCRGNWPA